MSRPIPLNERESDGLEFKSRDALREPVKIGREVVAMLNAGGGEVWIGLRDEQGVAVEIEGIDDPEAARRALHDSLIDRIEPPPLQDEVQVDVVGEGPKVLVVTVRPERERGPYDLLDRGGRHFLVRIGDRIRYLSRGEIRDRFQKTVAGGIDRADRLLLERQRELLEDGRSALWLGFAPLEGEPDLALQRLLDRDYLQRAEATGVRRSGHSVIAAFQAAPLAAIPIIREVRPQGGTSWAAIGVENGALLSVSRHAEIDFETPLKTISSFSSIAEFEGMQVLYPTALLEYTVSTFRLAGRIFGDTEVGEGGIWRTRPAERGVACRFALVGVKGWLLVPGRDDDLRLWMMLRHSVRPFPEEDFLLPAPETFTLAEVQGEPDRCAWRLLGTLYEGFGWEREQVPYFEEAGGVFRFP